MREIERRDRTFHARLSRPGRILSTHYLMATRCIANAIRDTEEVGMAAKTIKNVHGFCTWDDGADCGSCPDHYQLHCKWDRRLFYAFLMLYLPFLVSGWFGMAMTANTPRIPTISSNSTRLNALRLAFLSGGKRLGSNKMIGDSPVLSLSVSSASNDVQNLFNQSTLPTTSACIGDR